MCWSFFTTAKEMEPPINDAPDKNRDRLSSTLTRKHRDFRDNGHKTNNNEPRDSPIAGSKSRTISSQDRPLDQFAGT
jgi:hypothetical protein